jgi:hypothetical protein
LSAIASHRGRVLHNSKKSGSPLIRACWHQSVLEIRISPADPRALLRALAAELSPEAINCRASSTSLRSLSLNLRASDELGNASARIYLSAGTYPPIAQGKIMFPGADDDSSRSLTWMFSDCPWQCVRQRLIPRPPDQPITEIAVSGRGPSILFLFTVPAFALIRSNATEISDASLLL